MRFDIAYMVFLVIAFSSLMLFFSAVLNLLLCTFLEYMGYFRFGSLVPSFPIPYIVNPMLEHHLGNKYMGKSGTHFEQADTLWMSPSDSQFAWEPVRAVSHALCEPVCTPYNLDNTAEWWGPNYIVNKWTNLNGHGACRALAIKEVCQDVFTDHIHSLMLHVFMS